MRRRLGFLDLGPGTDSELPGLSSRATLLPDAGLPSSVTVASHLNVPLFKLTRVAPAFHGGTVSGLFERSPCRVGSCRLVLGAVYRGIVRASHLVERRGLRRDVLRGGHGDAADRVVGCQGLAAPARRP